MLTAPVALWSLCFYLRLHVHSEYSCAHVLLVPVSNVLRRSCMIFVSIVMHSYNVYFGFCLRHSVVLVWRTNIVKTKEIFACWIQTKTRKRAGKDKNWNGVTATGWPTQSTSKFAHLCFTTSTLLKMHVCAWRLQPVVSTTLSQVPFVLFNYHLWSSVQDCVKLQIIIFVNQTRVGRQDS